MLRKFYLLFLNLVVAVVAIGQNVGIGIASPNGSAQLDISSTSRGLLIPRMTSAGVSAISNPAKGLLVYDSVKNQLLVNMGTPSAPDWQTTVIGSGWGLNGNAGTDPATQFIGSTDGKPVNFRVNNVAAGKIDTLSNIFWGLRAGQKNSSGYGNIAVGTDALKLNTTANGQVAIGDSSLMNNSNAVENTAVGYKALMGTLNDYGNYQNVAVGTYALMNNFSGYWNVGLGNGALSGNRSGSACVGVGFQALQANSGGIANVGVGLQALYANTIGDYNTGVGNESLQGNTTGTWNAAVGAGSLFYSSTGGYNSALGGDALFNNGAGTYNVGVGYNALLDNSDSYNTAVGVNALAATTLSEYNTAVGYNAGSSRNQGYNNVFLGANTGATGDGFFNCIAIGQDVYCTGSSQVRIGNPATSSIGGYVGWSTLSDGRFKKDVKENVKGLDFILKLRPVTYRLDMAALRSRQQRLRGNVKNAVMTMEPTDNDTRVLSGFVAQEVEKAAEETAYDFGGVDKPKNDNDTYTMRYGDFIAPLVKAVQELHAEVGDLRAENAQLKQRLAALETKNK